MSEWHSRGHTSELMIRRFAAIDRAIWTTLIILLSGLTSSWSGSREMDDDDKEGLYIGGDTV